MEKARSALPSWRSESQRRASAKARQSSSAKIRRLRATNRIVQEKEKSVGIFGKVGSFFSSMVSSTDDRDSDDDAVLRARAAHCGGFATPCASLPAAWVRLDGRVNPRCDGAGRIRRRRTAGRPAPYRRGRRSAPTASGRRTPSGSCSSIKSPPSRSVGRRRCGRLLPQWRTSGLVCRRRRCCRRTRRSW